MMPTLTTSKRIAMTSPMTRTIEARVGRFKSEDQDAESPLRVVIADDHPFYRAALARLLERNGLEVVAEVPNGEAAIRAVEETRPDVVVADLNMPGSSGLAATRELAQRLPATPVMVLSVSADENDVTEAILAGASGYMLKDRPHAEIVAGVRAAAVGQSPLSPRIAAMLIRRLRETEDLDEDEIRGRVADYLSGRARPRPPIRPAPRLPRRW
jgi:DNA-binding NarL/FixJ family response regulator